MKRFVVCAAVLVALFAAGVATAFQPGPAAEASKASKASKVSIDHFEFLPGTLRIGKGAQVTFTNASGTAHTATDKGVFDTGRIKPGHSVSVRFARKGTFSYHCKIHPFMHGKIVVG